MTLSQLLHRRRHGGLTRRQERGAAIVELAMVVPVLIMLVMGIVDFAVIFNQKIGLRGGVREAAWNSSRGIYGAPVAADCPLHFSGPSAGPATQRIMCMAKRRSGLDTDEVRVMVRLVDPANRTAPGTYQVGHAVMVCAMRQASSTTHFWSSLFNNSFQRSRLTSVIVGVDAANPVTVGAEAPFANAAGGWDFCDPNRPAPQ